MADVLNNPMHVDDNMFHMPIAIDSNGTVSKVLKTANKYVDKDIKVEITTPDATYEVTANEAPVATAGHVASDYLTSEANDHAIVLTADATKAASKVEVDQAGFAAADDAVTVPATTAEQATKTVYIVEGSMGGSAQAAATTETIKMKEGTGDFTFTAGADGAVSVTKAGWIDAGAKVEVEGSKTYAVQAATVGNAAVEGATYTEGHSGAVASGGYLYINEGYIKDTKISLAEIVPDEANIGVTTSDDLIYKTVTAYDKDGALVTGSMQDATLSAIQAEDASATVDTITVTANAAKDKFEVTGSKAIEGTTEVHVATTGYAVKDELSAEGVISGTANVAAELNVIAVSAVMADGQDPSIATKIEKQTSTAKSGDITDTAPAGHYVAVSVPAAGSTIQITPVVTGAGYGTAEVNKATPTTVDFGTDGVATQYIAIEDGSVVSTVSAGEDVEKAITVELTSAATGVLDTAPTVGEYITISAETNAPSATISGTVSTAVTEGYVTSDMTNEKTVTANFSTVKATGAKYIAVYDGAWI